MLELSAKAQEPVNVIVVGRLPDTRLYIEVMEHGAYDFIAPPIADSDLAHVLRCALDNIIYRRYAQKPLAR